jgi:branched-subunit amino acid transport protein
MGLLQTNPKGTEWIAVETPFLLLALVAVALRLWARKLKRRTLEFNDYAILVAIVRQFRPNPETYFCC